MRAFLICTLAFVAFAAQPAVADRSLSGTWSVETSKDGSISMRLAYRDAGGMHESDNEHSLTGDAAAAIPRDALTSQGRHATFSMTRDAGRFDFDGWLANGKGGGTYTLELNQSFFDTLKARGYDVSTDSQSFAIAATNLRLSYIDAMGRLGLHPEIGNLIAMSALGVDEAYVKDLRSTGLDDLTVGNIIAMRALHIDGAYVRYLRAHGITHLTAGNVIALKAQHV